MRHKQREKDAPKGGQRGPETAPVNRAVPDPMGPKESENSVHHFMTPARVRAADLKGDRAAAGRKKQHFVRVISPRRRHGQPVAAKHTLVTRSAAKLSDGSILVGTLLSPALPRNANPLGDRKAASAIVLKSAPLLEEPPQPLKNQVIDPECRNRGREPNTHDSDDATREQGCQRESPAGTRTLVARLDRMIDHAQDHDAFRCPPSERSYSGPRGLFLKPTCGCCRCRTARSTSMDTCTKTSRRRRTGTSTSAWGSLNYRPAKLSDIRRLARRLVEGRIGPGHNTPPETARDQPYQGNSSVERDVGREQKGGSKPHAYNRLDTAPQKRGQAGRVEPADRDTKSPVQRNQQCDNARDGGPKRD